MILRHTIRKINRLTPRATKITLTRIYRKSNGQSLSRWQRYVIVVVVFVVCAKEEIEVLTFCIFLLLLSSSTTVLLLLPLNLNKYTRAWEYKDTSYWEVVYFYLFFFQVLYINALSQGGTHIIMEWKIKYLTIQKKTYKR